MKYCCDCTWLNPDEGTGKNAGKFQCTNPRVEDNYVSARKAVRGSEVLRECPQFLECFAWNRCSYDKDKLWKISKNHGYYVVTAICEILGLDHNCELMNTFQYLRDMIFPKAYPKFVEEYEIVGPQIAEKIKEDSEGIDYINYLYETYLSEMVDEVNEGSILIACVTYIKMISLLEARYNITLPKEENNIKENNIKVLK